MNKAGLLAGIACLALMAGNARAQQYDKAYDQRLVAAPQGTVVELPGFLSEKLPAVPYNKLVLPGPQYIISDDPEYIRVPEAIALQENVQPGSVRLYVYNVNGVKEPAQMPRKITALIKNTGSAPLHLRMLKHASQKPSANYFQIGKQGLADFMASAGSDKVVTLLPGKAMPIDEKLEQNVVKYDELAHGFYEFTVDQPAQITVLQTDPATTGVNALARIKNILPPKSQSGAGRGLYGISNYLVRNEGVIDTKNGPVALTVADGDKDPWIQGFEQTTGKQARLAGNYGVMYQMRLKWKSTGGKGLALVTWNARSANNKWCGGMAAAMKVSGGKYPAGIIQLPSNKLTTRGAPEAVVIQVFTPEGAGEEQEINLLYSPPGASCLPTPLIFIPVDLK